MSTTNMTLSRDVMSLGIRPHVCCLLSGGLDSSTLYWALVRSGVVVHPLTVHYGQRHAVEMLAAARMVHAVQELDNEQPDYRQVDIKTLFEGLKGNSLTDLNQPVPEGHYADPTMKATVVPNRNMMLISLAGSYAISRECRAVAYAAHAGDHAIYPDCRPEFFVALDKALKLCHYEPLPLLAPFIGATKTDIVEYGAQLEMPFEHTYSCYNGGRRHCGKCGTCVERREAFNDAGVKDPTLYEG